MIPRKSAILPKRQPSVQKMDLIRKKTFLPGDSRMGLNAQRESESNVKKRATVVITTESNQEYIDYNQNGEEIKEEKSSDLMSENLSSSDTQQAQEYLSPKVKQVAIEVCSDNSSEKKNSRNFKASNRNLLGDESKP